MKEYTDSEQYLSDKEAEHLINSVIPKHKLLELVSEEDLDNSEYSWMEKITIQPGDFNKQIEDIVACGSYEAWEAS